MGTDRPGPIGLCEEDGEIAFSFGNMAQDEGAVMAEFAMDRGWENAVIVKDNLIAYFQDVLDAFDVRYQELGGNAPRDCSKPKIDNDATQAVSGRASALWRVK